VSVGDIEQDEQTGEEMEETPPEAGTEPVAPEVAGPVQSTPGAMPPSGAPA